MIHNLIEMLNKVDKKVMSVINIGLYGAFFICLIGVIVLAIHYKVYISPNLYYIGIGIFKIGLWTAVSFIICGIGLWGIKQKI